MAVTPLAWRIARVSLTTAEPEATCAFFHEALGFEEIGAEDRAGEDFARLMGLPGARAQVRLLRLGQQEVELVAFAEKGRPYPPDSRSSDLSFQHMAIVVSDMRAAHARLSVEPGWTAISRSGPQRLPESSGGVTAFKFRDPEGHPLELLEFPPARTPATWRRPHGADPCLGIDHSAIVVANTAASAAFYRQLGFAPTARSLNRGTEQEQLDGISGAEVEVTALRPAAAAAPPHLELLCYRPPSAGRPPPAGTRSNDVVTTRLVLDAGLGIPPRRKPASIDACTLSDGAAAAGDGREAVLLRDPDGHNLVLVS
jgi:catechol 2,3-dioxygenase-like lactoylglutathione lyase family enzyme